MKFTEQDLHLILETPEIYEKVTLPHLAKEQFTLDWVYNILEHKQETEKIIYEDSEFILLPDYKWNGQKESLYLLAIVTARDIKSIRDLNKSHLPLLENINSKCLETIKSKFGVDPSQIRAYFHYQPSFYHLHVHFTYLKYDAPGIFCEKSHLLASVINNIQLVPDYYKKSSLTFAVRENDKWFVAYKKILEQSQ
jgi:m7GpppX diphosphatase